jgi:hypothetical protein
VQSQKLYRIEPQRLLGLVTSSVVVVVVTYEIIRLSVAWYWNCYSTLHVKDFGRTLSNMGCCCAGRMKFLQATAAARSRAGNVPRRSSPTPPLPDAALPRQTLLRPPGAAAPSRAAAPQTLYVKPSHVSCTAALHMEEERDEKELLKSFSSSSSLHSVAHVELGALSSHAAGHHRPPHRIRERSLQLPGSLLPLSSRTTPAMGPPRWLSLRCLLKCIKGKEKAKGERH